MNLILYIYVNFVHTVLICIMLNNFMVVFAFIAIMYRSSCGKIYISMTFKYIYNFKLLLCNHVHRDTIATTLNNEYPEVYKELKWQCIAMFSLTSMASYVHALALASLKTWNPKESAGRETVSLAFCATGSSSGREVLSTSCSR